METKYKIIGITEYAQRFLCERDLEDLEQMIGCIAYESENKSIVDGRRMFIMPYGEETHIDFLELEEIQPTFFFENES